MKGKTTRKYWIKFDNCEVDLTDGALQISAKQYYQQLQSWDAKIEETKDDENCGQAFKHSFSTRKEHSTIYVDYLGFGTAIVYLYCEVCDEGYQFQKRRG